MTIAHARASNQMNHGDGVVAGRAPIELTPSGGTKISKLFTCCMPFQSHHHNEVSQKLTPTFDRENDGHDTASPVKSYKAPISSAVLPPRPPVKPTPEEQIKKTSIGHSNDDFYDTDIPDLGTMSSTAEEESHSSFGAGIDNTPPTSPKAGFESSVRNSITKAETSTLSSSSTSPPSSSSLTNVNGATEAENPDNTNDMIVQQSKLSSLLPSASIVTTKFVDIWRFMVTIMFFGWLRDSLNRKQQMKRLTEK